MNLLVTGINGWIAQAMARSCRDRGHGVRGSIRRGAAENVISAGNIDSRTDWSTAVAGCDGVVHLAARVHVMNDRAAEPLAAFREVNVAGTLRLAQQAAAAGVKRFLFLSSIKVNGEATSFGRPFRADDQPAPEDPYGISKLEAEQALWQVASETDMEVVIVRPPLVYGPGVKANFAFMMRWLDRGIPLPLGAVTENRRSLVGLDNLVDLMATCLSHPAAANQTFLVSDGEDMSTADLLQRMGRAMNKPARLFDVPLGVLRSGAALLNKESMYQRLCGSLQVDVSKTRQLLNWTPPVSVDEGLRRAASGLRR